MENAERVDLAMSFIRSEMGEEVHESEDKNRETLREQDRFLPIANVARIMKKGIPKTGKIAKDARECVQECVSEFISFITSEASDRCHQEKRKTINGEDILWAMNSLGFENYVEPLKLYLQKYREVNKGEKVEGSMEGAYDADYTTIPSFGAEHVTQSDIISGYGAPGQQLSAQYTL